MVKNMREYRKGKNELKQEFIELRAKGYSYRDIEEEIGISRSTLCNWSSELEEEIARVKAIELDSLYEQYYLKKKNKIEFLGGLLENIKEELMTRDLTEVDTDKLFELALKYMDKLEGEKVETKLLSDKDINKLKNDKDITKLDSKSVSREIDNVLTKYKAGMIDKDQLSKSVYALRAKLKAVEQEELERKLERLETILEGRS